MSPIASRAAFALLLAAAVTAPRPAESQQAQPRKDPAPAVEPVPAPPQQGHPKPALPAAAAPLPGITVTPHAPAATPPVPAINAWLSAKEAVKDLGDLDRGTPAKHTFIVKNTGTKQLKIIAKPG